VISPNLRSVISDSNLMKSNRIFLCGGGMYYEDLVNCFKEEYGEIAQLTIVSDPELQASKGYALNSLRISGGQKKSSIGIDIGNSTTVVTQPI
jgi:plasmid segregation protein ParM